jgi:hypothetical protein
MIKRPAQGAGPLGQAAIRLPCIFLLEGAAPRLTLAYNVRDILPGILK